MVKCIEIINNYVKVYVFKSPGGFQAKLEAGWQSATGVCWNICLNDRDGKGPRHCHSNAKRLKRTQHQKFGRRPLPEHSPAEPPGAILIIFFRSRADVPDGKAGDVEEDGRATEEAPRKSQRTAPIETNTLFSTPAIWGAVSDEASQSQMVERLALKMELPRLHMIMKDCGKGVGRANE